jgi:hypothetical protein
MGGYMRCKLVITYGYNGEDDKVMEAWYDELEARSVMQEMSGMLIVRDINLIREGTDNE